MGFVNVLQGPPGGFGRGGGGGGPSVELLSLPHLRHFDDDTIGSSDGIAAAYYGGNTQTVGSVQLDDKGNLDNNIYCDQCWELPVSTSPDYAFNYIDLGAALPTTGFRLMWSSGRIGSNRDCNMLAKLTPQAPVDSDGDNNALQIQCNYGGDKYIVNSWDGDGNLSTWAEQSWGTNHQADGWKHSRVEFNPSIGAICAKTGYNLGVAWEYQKTVVWKSGYEIPEGLRYFTSYNANTGIGIGYIWVGSLTDSWPTSISTA